MVDVKKLSGNLILMACALVSLAYTPFLNIDPVAPAKMAVLGIFGLLVLPLIFLLRKRLLQEKILILILLFTIDLILVFFISGANKTEQFYGTIGRNFGLLSQISLILICVLTYIVSTVNLIVKIKKLILQIGSINIIYGFIQVMGEDFVKNWATTYVNSARGFFANPNQFSSFIAISALVSCSNFFSSRRSKGEKFGSSLYVVLSVIALYFAKSTQGYVILIFGILVLFLIYIVTSQKTIFARISVLFGSIVFLFFAVLDVFQKSPWNPIIYQDTISYRGDYWRAGIGMGLDNPFFGIGLDKYLDWYRIKRDAVTFSRPFSKEVTDSAHNIYLDYFAFGGFPLLILYILLTLVVMWKIFKIIKFSKNYDENQVSAIIIFVGFFLQSLISPSHLGLMIWGWVSMGIVLGIEVEPVPKTTIAQSRNFLNIKADEKVLVRPKIITLLSLTVLAIGIFVSSAFMIQDARFRQAIKSNSNFTQVASAAYFWPKSGSRMAQVSWLLYQNNFKEESLRIGLDAVKYSPNNYLAWLVLYSRTDLDPILRSNVLVNIRRLEPRFDESFVLQ